MIQRAYEQQTAQHLFDVAIESSLTDYLAMHVCHLSGQVALLRIARGVANNAHLDTR